MDKGKMTVKEVCNNSNGSESDDVGRLVRETELSMKSGGEEDQEVKGVVKSQSSKRGRYHRHTPEQVQEMEMLFKEFPHPNEKQKVELSIKLGMQPLQVKFWFQNKRNQMKSQHEHRENEKLRIENEKLQAESTRIKEALNNATCSACGGSVGIVDMSLEEFKLNQDNAELRKEIDRISSLVAGYVGKPLSPQ